MQRTRNLTLADGVKGRGRGAWGAGLIGDLSLSLRTLLIKGGADFLELATANVAFDRPADGFNPTQPTISLYLYDVRENTELRSNERDIQVVNGRASLNRGPLRVQCTYLVTAWPGAVTGDALALAEQTLLSQALMVFARYPSIPATFLMGALAGQQPSLPVITAQAEGLRNPSEFWTALSNKMRPSLSVAVTLSMQPMAPTDEALVRTSEIRLGAAGVQQFDVFSVGGLVTGKTGAAASAPLPGALIRIQGTGLTATADSTGRYVLPAMTAGTFVAHVTSGALAKDLPLTIPAPAGAGYDLTLN